MRIIEWKSIVSIIFRLYNDDIGTHYRKVRLLLFEFEIQLVSCRSHAGIGKKAIIRYCHFCSAIVGVRDLAATAVRRQLVFCYNSTIVTGLLQQYDCNWSITTVRL
jgi:hypothetical protein